VFDFSEFEVEEEGRLENLDPVPEGSGESIIAHHKFELAVDLPQSLAVKTYLGLARGNASECLLGELPALSV
jgi:hypothetical protein